jgi:hypothetical protein
MTRLDDFANDAGADVERGSPSLRPPPGGRSSGFGDPKKVVILAVLGLAAAGVVGYQFLGKGPSEAAAVTISAGGAAGAAAATDVESVLKRLDSGAPNATPGGEGLTVDRVEQLVKRFDTYVQERQLPLDRLNVNPFEVVRTAEVVVEDTAKAKAKEVRDEAAERKKRVQEAASRLKLGSVMIVGPKRLAIVSGKLCRPGDAVEGFQVEAIDADSVTLSMEGEQITLALRQDGSTRKP